MKPIAHKRFSILLTNELYWSKAYQSLTLSARNLLWCMVAELRFTANSNYLQLYTPNEIQAIAIEPMTGVSDSFNNKIGLKELNPRENYKIKWSLNILTNAKNELVFKK